MAATASTHHPKKKPSSTIRFRRRRIKETTISSSATTTTPHHHNPSAVSPENTSWCCPPAVSSYKPSIPPPPSSPSPESFSAEKHPPLHLPENLKQPQITPTPTTTITMSTTTFHGGAGTYQEPLNTSSFTQFNSALNAGLLNLNPISSPPPTRSSPTLFEMMANEPDSKIPNTVTIPTPKRNSNSNNGHLIPPVDKQSLMQQRLLDILSCGSPGSLFNDPNSSDVKLTLSSKDGLSVCMNVHRQILVAHSRFFADKLVDIRRKVGQQGQQLRGLIDNSNPYIVEIADCDDIEVYIESIRLMYCKDLRRKLMKDDVPRVLGILKVSAAIGFDAGVLSCLEYLEAAPWAEDDEEKVSSLLSELQLEGASVGDVLKRVSVDVTRESEDDNSNNNNQEILLKLLHVVLEGKDEKARRDMKVLVSKMLHENASRNDLKKESLYSACDKCLHLLQRHFLKASKGDLQDADQITRQSGNLHWLLDILIDRQISEDFLKLWASQTELSEVHSKVPAIHRYEISRVTARLFVGIGKGQLLASKESRCLLLQTWLVPFYDDFTWMRRGSRGLDRNLIEEGLSNTILTLPLAWQQEILMSWFDRFLNSGDDCPNIQKGFEIWWKRAFWRNPEVQREFRVTNANGGNS